MEYVMARPINPNPPVTTCKIREKQKNGWIYVYEKSSRYDHKCKYSKNVTKRLLGKIPPGSTSLDDMVPTGKRGRPAKTSVAGNNLLTASEEFKKTDNRLQERVKFPLHYVLALILWGLLKGFNTCVSLGKFWNASIDRMRKIFPDFPEEKVSHDTIRRFIIMLGKAQDVKLIQYVNESIMLNLKTEVLANATADEGVEQCERTVYPLDGQAIRASKIEPGSGQPRYVLNFFDCRLGLSIEQELVGEKTNEIKHSCSLIDKVDIRGGIVTVDSLNSTSELAKKIVDKEADYCFMIKGNRKATYTDIKEKFECDKYTDEMSIEPSCEKAHGRIEERTVRVLPATLLEEDTLKNWKGLEYGCIAEIRSKRNILSKDKKTEDVRYFICTLNFDKEYIAKQLLQVIRSHWHIENKLHWILDVNFNQDRIQCKNADFIKGMTIMTKLAYNIGRAFMGIILAKTNVKLSYKALQAELTNADTFFSLLQEATQRKSS